MLTHTCKYTFTAQKLSTAWKQCSRVARYKCNHVVSHFFGCIPFYNVVISYERCKYTYITWQCNVYACTFPMSITLTCKDIYIQQNVAYTTYMHNIVFYDIYYVILFGETEVCSLRYRVGIKHMQCTTDARTGYNTRNLCASFTFCVIKKCIYVGVNIYSTATYVRKVSFCFNIACV